MRIDAYTHFIPKRFFEAVEKIPGAGTDIGKRMRGVPCLLDLDERRRIVSLFPDYAQILSYPMPPLESFASGDQLDELCRMINDGFADIVRQHPDQFPGFVAQVSLASPGSAVKEAQRAIRDLGACGVQIFTNVNGAPIDRPQYEEFWSAMEKLDKPVWMHPARTAARPDYVDEKKSLYEIWWTFGWSYETAAAMARLGRVYDNWMVYVALTNQKLRKRARQILEDAAGVTPRAAEHALRQSGYSLPAALVRPLPHANGTYPIKGELMR